MGSIWVHETTHFSVTVPELWCSISVVRAESPTNLSCKRNVECLPCNPLRNLQSGKRSMAKGAHKLMSLCRKRPRLHPTRWQPAERIDLIGICIVIWWAASKKSDLSNCNLHGVFDTMWCPTPGHLVGGSQKSIHYALRQQFQKCYNRTNDHFFVN